MQGPPPPPKEWRLRLLPKDDPEDVWLTNDGVRFTNSIWYHTGGNGIKESPLDRLQLDKTEIFKVPPGHRAYPGRGLRVRAGCVLEEDTDVGYYTGIFRPGIFAPDNAYVFAVGPRDLDLVIDAARVGNETRFINDCYNMPDRQVNLEALDQEIAYARLVIRTIVFRTLRRIEAGEELFFTYQASAQGYWPTPEIIDLTHDPETQITRVKRERSADSANSGVMEPLLKARIHRCPINHDHQVGPRHCKDCGRISQTPCRKCDMWYSASGIAQHEKTCQNRGKRG